MSISDLKFTEAEMVAKSVTALADRPELSAAELKERMDSGDIRVKMNAVIDDVAAKRDLEQRRLLNRVVAIETPELSSVVGVASCTPPGERLVVFILSTGKIFYGTSEELLSACMMNEL